MFMLECKRTSEIVFIIVDECGMTGFDYLQSQNSSIYFHKKEEER